MDNKTNCSNLWRHPKQYQINLNDLFGDSIPRKYTFKTVPKGTFNYWLSHIESQNRISDKSFFADKFLMKQYIINYTKIYPLFNRIHHTKILWDFSKDGNPSFNQLWNLKKKNQSFLVKPNHTSNKQIIVNPNEYFSRQLYHRIMKQSRKWFVNEHKKNVGRTKREPWYKLINPRIFIEENINVDPVNYPLTEYNLHVFNHKALFIFVYKHNEMMNVKNLNFYTIPDFKWLNATWWPKKNETHKNSIPLKENLDVMIAFSEHFAMRENFEYVRVDFNEVNDTMYFSEFTFQPGGGVDIIRPLAFDFLLYDILCGNNQITYEKIYEYT